MGILIFSTILPKLKRYWRIGVNGTILGRGTIGYSQSSQLPTKRSSHSGGGSNSRAGRPGFRKDARAYTPHRLFDERHGNQPIPHSGSDVYQ